MLNPVDAGRTKPFICLCYDFCSTTEEIKDKKQDQAEIRERQSMLVYTSFAALFLFLPMPQVMQQLTNHLANERTMLAWIRTGWY
jgi:hypothetical protein